MVKVGENLMVSGKNILQGMMGAYLMEGIDVDKIDWDNHILYITLPKQSYSYEISETIKSASDYAKRIKEVWIEMGIFPKDCIVKYRVKNIIWTKQMGEENFKTNKDKILSLSL